MRFQIKDAIYTGTFQDGFQGNNGWVATTKISGIWNTSYQDRSGQTVQAAKQFNIQVDKNVALQLPQIPINSKVTLSGTLAPGKDGRVWVREVKKMDVIEMAQGQPQQQNPQQAPQQQTMQQAQQPAPPVSQPAQQQPIADDDFSDVPF